MIQSPSTHLTNLKNPSLLLVKIFVQLLARKKGMPFVASNIPNAFHMLDICITSRISEMVMFDGEAIIIDSQNPIVS